MSNMRRTLIVTKVKNGYLLKSTINEPPEVLVDTNPESFYNSLGAKLFVTAHQQFQVGKTYQVMTDFVNLSTSLGDADKIDKSNEEQVKEETPKDFYEAVSSAMRHQFYMNTPPDCFLISPRKPNTSEDYYLFLGDAAIYVAELLEMEYSIILPKDKSGAAVYYLKIPSTKYNNMRISLIGCNIKTCDDNLLTNINKQYLQRIEKTKKELQDIAKKELTAQRKRQEETSKPTGNKPPSKPNKG